MAKLDLLVRLARQAVDHECKALQRVNADIIATERRISDLGVATARESGLGPDILTSGATLHAYARANRQRKQAAIDDLLALRQRHETQLQRLREKRVELKRYERLVERRAVEAAREAAEKEQKTIDELAMIKAGRRSID